MFIEILTTNDTLQIPAFTSKLGSFNFTLTSASF